ncbi:TMhelix containing protein [Vibrio phage 1.238.A._10N.261.52.F10]|uniref:TMhelix containing protein n=1 Tax=Vibrio phage 1.238.A._10N.261.52.F10 TaxID=1881231 RepID=A0A2I7RUK2_9CAUD|nr:TMhelix containing protein [Vibrio phage 1.238.A._10N.261.52.F10]AUR97251.1 TMhelix containing protein [Vibrio phage 1.238.A._10N.261.52.F10]AUR97345.1 TMhelix containing protein [Vibrio phage 1.238.B._10N.261.52.F10]
MSRLDSLKLNNTPFTGKDGYLVPRCTLVSIFSFYGKNIFFSLRELRKAKDSL